MNCRATTVHTSDVVVIGAGVAGLSVATHLPKAQVTVVTRGLIGRSGTSPMAKGGIAAAMGKSDSPQQHATDTLATGGGLSDRRVVNLLTQGGPDRIRELISIGTKFDRDALGRLELGREAAHSQPRILHAGGDATGAELMRALVGATASHESIHVEDDTEVLDLVVERGRVVGVLARKSTGETSLLLARAVVLATGGIGAAFARTTNPSESIGDGLAIAARAGAVLADLEFVQFHPTALSVGSDPMPLLTEALRGAGGILVNSRGQRIMTSVHPDGDLAPRDIVARAIWENLQHGEAVYLDARPVGRSLKRRFPSAVATCRQHQLNLAREPVPVSPAAHYHMGGIAVDAQGKSSLPGLWACGEATRSGVHGANRLASNSLLEGLVFGARAAQDILQALPITSPPTALVPTIPHQNALQPSIVEEARSEVRNLLWKHVGLVRDRSGLEHALEQLKAMRQSSLGAAPELRNLLTTTWLVAKAALARAESRGGHFRSDFPHLDPESTETITLQLGHRTQALTIRPQPLEELPTSATGSSL